MRRSKYRRADRSAKWFTGRRHIVAAVATLVAFGGIVTVTQVSDASTGASPSASAAASPSASAAASPSASAAASPSASAAASPSASAAASPSANESAGATPSASAGTGTETAGGQNGGIPTPPPGAGLGILTNSCDTSTLERHDGFQIGDRCVSTEFGEVGSAANNPSLLITEAPERVGVGEPFTLRVSTRNLIRDRFLAAGQGGYYVESSVLQDGIVRGHFHTACRILGRTSEAPDPAPVPGFFVATEDRQGGRTPDQVSIRVPGIPQAGTAQCASWAGDGSHRIPMMQRANQTPAFDAVRIEVGDGDGGDEDAGEQGGDQDESGDQDQAAQDDGGGQND